MKRILWTLVAVFLSTYLNAQSHRLQAGDFVENIEVRTSKNDPTMLPYFGEKVLFIFYADPDRPNKNNYFIDKLNALNIGTDIIYTFGVVNLKNTFMPNSLVRLGIRIKQKLYKDKNPQILTDPKFFVRNAWNLGEVNNDMCLLMVDTTGQVLFYENEELDEKQSDALLDKIVKLKASRLQAMKQNP